MRPQKSRLIWLAVAEAAAADLSLFDRSALLDGALLAQFGNDSDGCQRFWVQDVFTDYVIARSTNGGNLYRIGYSIDKLNAITLTDAQEVETAYVPVAEAGHFVTEASDSDAANDAIYPVSVLKAGWGGGILAGSSLPHYYPPVFVAEVAEAANSAKFGRRHPQPEPGYQYGENDPDRIAGWFSDGAVAASVSEARANLNLLESETALRGKFAAARKAGKLDMFGLSILATVGFAPATVEGKKCLEAKKLGKLYSIDLVGEAGAGGRFLQEMRVAASADASGEIAAAQLAAVKQGSSAHLVRHNNAQVREDQMKNKQMILRVIEALRTQDATSATAFQTELNTAAEEKYEDIFTRVTEALSTATTAASTAAQTAANATLAEAKKLQFVNVMEAKLNDSKLPEPAKKLVRGHFEKMTSIADGDLDLQITAVREAFAAANNSGRVSGIAALSLDGHDMAQIAMDRMLGVKGHETSGVIAFHGIREAYSHITGDFDLTKLRASGATFFSRVSEAVSTTDFPNLLLNSMTKRLLQDYAELGIDGLDVLYQKANIDSYKLQDRVRDGYFPELAVVAEGAPYTEIVKPTDERVNYAVGNYGNLLTISEQTIRNDDLGAIARFPTRLARAGRKTLKRFITNYFLNNPAYMADGVTWFNAAHGNLGSAALSQDALIALEIALFQQTEKDSGEQLGLTLDWLMVPIQVKALAIQINQTNTAGANTFFHRFGDNNERIIVNEMLTDDNDFYGGTNQANAPFLEIGFLDGLEQPQIFLANNPVVGTQFTNDQLQYKVKHVFGGAIIDYRGVQKNVVAG
jgi:hypothetical protein